MKKDLKGKRILVTAGPTREYIDAVRFISNPSTGMMGYALATAAREHGAKVILISGPTHLTPPKGVKIIRVTTADEMFRATMRHFPTTHAVIKTAAVADYRPARISRNKRKKKAGPWNLCLIRTPDILATLSRKRRHQILVGFAAESRDLIKNAKRKLRRKKLDFIVANRIGRGGRGFGTTKHSVILIDSKGNIKRLKPLPKKSLARRLLTEIFQKSCRSKRPNL